MLPSENAALYECPACRCTLEAVIWARFLRDYQPDGVRMFVYGCGEPGSRWFLVTREYRSWRPGGPVAHEVVVENLAA